MISDLESEGPMLKCLRYPPSLFVIDGRVHQGSPDATDLCGEFVDTPIRVYKIEDYPDGLPKDI